uniref:Myosin motor domain-containing protein n=1 Tax=Pyrodinium bahamense TaxID=73915 RepID=A0A7S0FM48_9DINO
MEGERRRVPMAEVCLRFAQGDGSLPQDNTSLVHMNEATILENLRLRHQKDQIYTYTASVLLAVNPYKEISGLYDDEQCGRYRGKHIGTLPPHPYAIADTAYRTLVREHRNQALLISGESGAGKTETAKIVMQFLSYASGTATQLTSRIQARVLQAQPILESFGNAVTMRNSNSSRFGKYNRLFFDQAGALVDADITTYLLESSRVVVHGDRERTYHCFYEMLTGLSDERLWELRLERNRAYRLMTCGSQKVEGFQERDARNFRRLCEAFKTVGLDGDAIDTIIEVLAGLVHLGDIQVDDDAMQAPREEDESQTVDVNEQSVESAARLLGMDADILCGTLKRKKVAVPGRNSFHEVPRTQPQFRQALHSLIKALYKRLFMRTVEHINGSFRELRPMDAKGIAEGVWNHIGILDIYGFERLQRNSFEQLCINLANERLQQYFVENVLVAEQSLYKREGLPWIFLNLPDSQPVINCVTQVFRTLDEYSQLANNRGSANDEQFCQKTLDDASKDPQRKEVLKQLKPLGGRRQSVVVGMVPPALNQGFVIKHYAGFVEYNTKGWLDKNNDRLLPECERLICESTCLLVSSLGEPDKAAFRSISKRYVADLEGLLKTLGTSNLHYIRCFKPNEEQRPNQFQPRLVLDQIVQCGTIELVKVMHDGYPNRCSFEEISVRFRSLLPESFQRYGMRTFIEALMLAYDVPREEWALGMSRLFLKAGQLRALEGMRSEGTQPKAEKLASIVRGIIRKRWGRAGNAVRLCNYLPKYLMQIYARRARRLAARRRFRSAVHVVQFTRAAAAILSDLRCQRLARVLRVAAIVYVRTRPWLALSRSRVAAALVRQQAEEERQRLEAERQEQECQRLEEERRRLKEERRSLEEERLKREEAERQRQQCEEEQRLRREAEERRCEEENQRIREERRALDEERKVVEEERKVLEQKRRLLIRAQASPQHAKSCTKPAMMGPSFAQETTQVDNSEGTCVDMQAFAGTRDDVCPGEKCSELVNSQVSALVPMAVKLQINERIKQLETEMARKQEEVMQQMRALQEKNESLERTLAEERAQHAAPSPVAEARGKASVASRGEFTPGPTTFGSPVAANLTQPRPEYFSFFPASRELSKTASAVTLSGSRLVGTGHRERRRSTAHEALSALGQENREHCAQPQFPDMVGSNGDIQRRWLAEQRDNLLEELYPNGSPGGAFARTPARDPWAGLVHVASAEASRTPGSAAAATVGARREVRDLSTLFERANDGGATSLRGEPEPEDLEHTEPCADDAPTSAQRGRDQALKADIGHGRLRPSASQFYWGKRGSTGGTPWV